MLSLDWVWIFQCCGCICMAVVVILVGFSSLLLATHYHSKLIHNRAFKLASKSALTSSWLLSTIQVWATAAGPRVAKAAPVTSSHVTTSWWNTLSSRWPSHCHNTLLRLLTLSLGRLQTHEYYAGAAGHPGAGSHQTQSGAVCQRQGIQGQKWSINSLSWVIWEPCHNFMSISYIIMSCQLIWQSGQSRDSG